MVTPHAKVASFRAQGGQVHSFNLKAPHSSLEVCLTATVETHLSDPFQQLNEMEDDWSIYDKAAMSRLYAEYLEETSYVRLSPSAHQLADEMRRDHEGGPWGWVTWVNRTLNQLLAFDPDVTHVQTTSDEVLELRQGVCQDFTHLMLALLRCEGIPCRYVSGYLYNGQGDHLRGDQFMHAWVDVLAPNGCWVGIDPTNSILANDHYIRVHVGSDYSEVSPVKGVFWGVPSEKPDVRVQVDRIGEVQSARNSFSQMQQSQ
jgi:transglutaminase-like putative cysteine protease